MSIHNLRKPITELTKDEFQYTQTPIGGPTYKHNLKRGRPIPENGKAKPTDRIKCEICGKEYFRSGSTKHKRTEYHRAMERVNKKLLDLLVD